MRNMMSAAELISGVMAHNFYPPEEVGFDQHSKRDSSSMPCSVHSDGHLEAMDRKASCVSPVTELDGKGRNPPRRRTQVACQRCRKRKIKCSGDNGDGQGCSNCRTSGNTNCQFLRVNSSALQTKVHSAWPYPSAPQASKVGMYAPQMSSKSGVYSVNSPNMRVGSFSRPSYDMATVDPHHFSRQTFGVDPNMAYEDNPSTACSTQPSAYMVSSGSQSALADYYGIAWNSKAWDPALQVKTQSAPLYADQEAENSLTQLNYSYILHGQSTQPTDYSSAMTSLSPEGQGADRTLPNPSSRNQLQTSFSIPPTSPEAISGLPYSQDARFGNPWATKSAPSTSSRTSTRSMSNGTFSASPVNRSKSIPSSAQDMVFGFMPMNSAGTSSQMLPSNGTFPGTGLDTVDSPDDYRTPTDTHFIRSYSRDHGRLISLTDCTPDVYGYSSSEKNKNRSEDAGSASTLMNGLQYTPVRHSDNHGPLTLNLLHPGTIPEYRVSAEAHRGSISSHGNPGGFYHQQELLKPT